MRNSDCISQKLMNVDKFVEENVGNRFIGKKSYTIFKETIQRIRNL